MRNADGTTITRHLTDVHGLRRLAFFSGPAHWFSSRERRSGYERAMSDRGSAVRGLHGRTTVNTGYGAMREALAQYPDLEGVVAVNDAIALGAIRACKSLAAACRDDLAVVD